MFKVSDVRPRAWTMFAAIVAVLAGLWLIRPLGIIHGPIMFFYTNPMLWLFPLIVAFSILAIGCAWRWFNLRNSSGSSPFRFSDLLFSKGSFGRTYFAAPVWAFLVCGTVAFLFGVFTTDAFNHNATYKYYKNSFSFIEDLPEAGQARIMPKQVAETISSAGFDSSTHKLGEGHIVMNPNGNLDWTFGQLPNKFWNKLSSQNTSGLVAQNAATTAREENHVNENFKIAPGTFFARNIKWHAYKKHYLTEIAEQVFIVTPDGEPLILAPYLSYKGFLTKVPVLEGIYVVHPDGEMEDLSPEEAAGRPEIANSGRVFPETLAREIQESYKYKNGIINRFTTHNDQIEIADDGGSNSQPYLMDFKGIGTKWVSTARPYGKAYAVKAIFMTDTITGETEVWQDSSEQSLTGSQRALDVVEGLSIPGILFANESDNSDSSGRFYAREPRPLIRDGELQFLVSVVPSTYNTVTKSVIVDAKTNKVVAIFNHDTDPNADAKLLAYMKNKDVDTTSAEIDETTGGEETEAPAGGNLTQLEEQRKLIQQLIEDNAEQARLLAELEAQLSK